MPEHIDTSRIQYFAIFGSIFIIILIIELIRKKKLKEEYSLLWLFLGMVFFVISIWRNGLEVISNFIGISYAPAALFLILLLILFMIMIHFSIIISKLSDMIKTLTQELGILKIEFEKKDIQMKKDKSKIKKGINSKQ